jgi:hypothetical protein
MAATIGPLRSDTSPQQQPIAEELQPHGLWRNKVYKQVFSHRGLPGS